MPFLFRHERVRPHQKDLMEDAYKALSDHKIFMAQAPTGLGKTDASISAALTYALEQKLTVFFLTPKISQHRIAIEAVNGIAAKNSLQVRAVDMIGRSHCCIDPSLLELDNESFQTACGRKRQKQHCMFYENARGYGRVGEARAENRFRVMLEGYGSGRSHNELVSLGAQKQCCPYEWLLKLAEISDVIVADYYHFMVPQIRDVFLMKTKKRIEDSVVIVDEAHNLAPRIRSSLSTGISSFLFARMSREMRHLGMDAGPVPEQFNRWGADLLGNEKEKTVTMESFHSFIGEFGLSFEDAIDRLEETGLAFLEKTNKKSACLRLARFMSEWTGDEPGCIRIAKRKGENIFLSKKMLDPSPATDVLNHTAGSILMSGTLLPLEMHRDVLGLDKERTVMRSYPSPFDSANVVNVITENLTTRYSRRDLEGYTAIANKLDAIISKTPGGSAIFFPSYEVMNNVLGLVLSRNLHVQKPGMRPADVRTLMKDFKRGGVLCGVQGGSLSEGVDFPEGEIKTVVIVGVALEEMGVESRALIDYFDEKFGRGWDYGYLYPGTIKALQAAGRARRKESDRVSIVYMDERFKWGKYNWILNKDERIFVTDRPEDAVEEFWKE
ncbi:MAG: ATP-dependent DNA helicase [Candidatus Micrarchaeia archaeon]